MPLYALDCCRLYLVLYFFSKCHILLKNIWVKRTNPISNTNICIWKQFLQAWSFFLYSDAMFSISTHRKSLDVMDYQQKTVLYKKIEIEQATFLRSITFGQDDPRNHKQNQGYFCGCPSWEKMKFLQNYCKNFCKILQENALTLTNSCKTLQNMLGFARVVCFLQNFCKSCVFFCKIFARVVFSFDESLSQCFCYHTKRIRYLRF